jgi:predicted RNA-binding Zn-ribbon protein involved in translation (DUF1610 family)
MGIQDLLLGLTKSSKKDVIPGTIDVILEDTCPACGKQLAKMKPCCGSPNGYTKCLSCGYRID